jgi:hypothetical protein
MVVDAGRITHLGDLMHRSIASNGSSVTSNWGLKATGLGGVVWTPDAGGSVSYGSNSNEVSYGNEVGASTLVSRADHVHRGVTSLSHASNTYTGPVTLETEGSLYIVRSAANTYRLGATGGGGGGGGGLTVPSVVQAASNGTSATTITIAAAASGNRLIMITNSTTGQITAPTCTNVTWTQIKTLSSTGSSFYAIWVGVVAGGSSGTTITVTKPGTFNTMTVLEIKDALTPTAGVSTAVSEAANTSAIVNVTVLTGHTAGHLVCFAGGQDNTATAGRIFPSVPCVGVHEGIDQIVVGYCLSTNIACQYFSTATGALLIAEIT